MAAAGLVIATQAAAQVTFYEHSGFRGQSVTADRPARNLERFDFNNRASSAVCATPSGCTSRRNAGSRFRRRRSGAAPARPMRGSSAALRGHSSALKLMGYPDVKVLVM
jgi:hypothetical protein